MSNSSGAYDIAVFLLILNVVFYENKRDVKVYLKIVDTAIANMKDEEK